MSRPADPAVRDHLEGLASGRLLLSECDRCGQRAIPARRACASCSSTSFTWRAAGGRGRVWSKGEFHQQYLPDVAVPYLVVLVELDDGGKVYGTLVASTYEEAGIGTPIHFDADRSRSGRPTFVLEDKP